MRPWIPVSLLLALGSAACGGHSGGSYVEAREPRLSCPAPVLRSGGLNPAVDPGPTCIGAPQPSALPAAGPGGAEGWIDLGERQVGEVVDVPVPTGTASLLLVEQLVRGGPAGQQVTVTFKSDGSSQVQDNVAVIGELHDPGGRLVYTDLEVISGADFSGALLFAQGAGAVVGSVAYPSTSAGLQAVGTLGVAPGTWRVMVNDYGYECWLAAQPQPPPGLMGISCPLASQASDTVYRLYALTTPAAAGGASAVRSSGALDVSIHLVDGHVEHIGFTAAQAPFSADVQRMVESYAALMAGAGICVATVTFYDAPDWAWRFGDATSASDPTPCGNLPQLLATSRPGQRTLELFMVPRLHDAPGASGTVVGVDGTIPGPATVNGTIASGAVFSAEDLGSGTCPAPGSGAAPRPNSCGADLAGYVAAHESGHYLGLYHPTESTGDQFDPLTDTPHCECTHCGLTAATCQASGLPGTRCTRPDASCGGGANLMFWVVGSASVGFLSPEQARIARTSPVVRSP